MAVLFFVLFFSLLVLGVFLELIRRFVRADADVAMLLKGPPPAGAFQDKVVWITGASQGIGETLALEFSKLGARLILSSRNEEKLQKVKEKCEGNRDVFILPLDLSSGSESFQKASKIADSFFGESGVDILIHNAGYPRPKMTCLETSDEYLRALFEVNVFGPIELSRAIVPKMIKRGKGSIVVVSSAAGIVPSPTQGAYAASKHALNGYFHTLRYELIKTGVTVSVLCPGPIATSTERRLPRKKEGEREREGEREGEGEGEREGEGEGEGEGVEWDVNAVKTATPDDEEETKNRMTAERCAELIISGTAHKVEEGWISRQPVLLFLYIMQYFPWLGHRLLRKIGPKRVAALKDGQKDLYNVNLLFGGTKKST